MALFKSLCILAILILLMNPASCQKGIPLCCCSSKYNHPTLTTTLDFSFHYLVSLMHMNYTAKAFYRQTSKFPQSYSKAIWTRATQLRKLNQDFNNKLNLAPPSQYDISDLKYCQSTPPAEQNRRLLTEATVKKYSSKRFPMPSPDDQFPLPYTKYSDDDESKIKQILGIVKSSDETDHNHFVVLEDNSSQISDSYDSIFSHLCRRGYAAYFKKEVSSTQPADPENGEPLYLRLMSTTLPEDELHQQLFQRWLGVFIESYYGQDKFEYFTCSDANAVCDTTC